MRTPFIPLNACTAPTVSALSKQQPRCPFVRMQKCRHILDACMTVRTSRNLGMVEFAHPCSMRSREARLKSVNGCTKGMLCEKAAVPPRTKVPSLHLKSSKTLQPIRQLNCLCIYWSIWRAAIAHMLYHCRQASHDLIFGCNAY